MFAIKLPSKWCRELQSLASSFLWGNGWSFRPFTPISWSRICKPKVARGLGIRKMKDMNLALLSKLGWFIATDSKKLSIQALKSKYLASSSFSNCKKKKNNSWMWNIILLSRKLIINGLCYRVGKRNKLNNWEDPWIPNNPRFKPIPSSEEATLKHGMVNSLR